MTAHVSKVGRDVAAPALTPCSWDLWPCRDSVAHRSEVADGDQVVEKPWLVQLLVVVLLYAVLHTGLLLRQYDFVRERVLFLFPLVSGDEVVAREAWIVAPECSMTAPPLELSQLHCPRCLQ